MRRFASILLFGALVWWGSHTSLPDSETHSVAPSALAPWVCEGNGGIATASYTGGDTIVHVECANGTFQDTNR